jgi:hypothetical protein
MRNVEKTIEWDWEVLARRTVPDRLSEDEMLKQSPSKKVFKPVVPQRIPAEEKLASIIAISFMLLLPYGE